MENKDTSGQPNTEETESDPNTETSNSSESDVIDKADRIQFDNPELYEFIVPESDSACQGSRTLETISEEFSSDLDTEAPSSRSNLSEARESMEGTGSSTPGSDKFATSTPRSNDESPEEADNKSKEQNLDSPAEQYIGEEDLNKYKAQGAIPKYRRKVSVVLPSAPEERPSSRSRSGTMASSKTAEEISAEPEPSSSKSKQEKRVSFATDESKKSESSTPGPTSSETRLENKGSSKDINVDPNLSAPGPSSRVGRNENAAPASVSSTPRPPSRSGTSGASSSRFNNNDRYRNDYGPSTSRSRSNEMAPRSNNYDRFRNYPRSDSVSQANRNSPSRWDNYDRYRNDSPRSQSNRSGYVRPYYYEEYPADIDPRPMRPPSRRSDRDNYAESESYRANSRSRNDPDPNNSRSRSRTRRSNSEAAADAYRTRSFTNSSRPPSRARERSSSRPTTSRSRTFTRSPSAKLIKNEGTTAITKQSTVETADKTRKDDTITVVEASSQEGAAAELKSSGNDAAVVTQLLEYLVSRVSAAVVAKLSTQDDTAAKVGPIEDNADVVIEPRAQDSAATAKSSIHDAIAAIERPRTQDVVTIAIPSEKDAAAVAKTDSRVSTAVVAKPSTQDDTAAKVGPIEDNADVVIEPRAQDSAATAKSSIHDAIAAIERPRTQDVVTIAIPSEKDAAAVAKTDSRVSTAVVAKPSTQDDTAAKVGPIEDNADVVIEPRAQDSAATAESNIQDGTDAIDRTKTQDDVTVAVPSEKDAAAVAETDSRASTAVIAKPSTQDDTAAIVRTIEDDADVVIVPHSQERAATVKSNIQDDTAAIDIPKTQDDVTVAVTSEKDAAAVAETDSRASTAVIAKPSTQDDTAAIVRTIEDDADVVIVPHSQERAATVKSNIQDDTAAIDIPKTQDDVTVAVTSGNDAAVVTELLEYLLSRVSAAVVAKPSTQDDTAAIVRTIEDDADVVIVPHSQERAATVKSNIQDDTAAIDIPKTQDDVTVAVTSEKDAAAVAETDSRASTAVIAKPSTQDDTAAIVRTIEDDADVVIVPHSQERAATVKSNIQDDTAAIDIPKTQDDVTVAVTSGNDAAVVTELLEYLVSRVSAAVVAKPSTQDDTAAIVRPIEDDADVVIVPHSQESAATVKSNIQDDTAAIDKPKTQDDVTVAVPSEKDAAAVAETDSRVSTAVVAKPSTQDDTAAIVGPIEDDADVVIEPSSQDSAATAKSSIKNGTAAINRPRTQDDAAVISTSGTKKSPPQYTIHEDAVAGPSTQDIPTGSSTSGTKKSRPQYTIHYDAVAGPSTQCDPVPFVYEYFKDDLPDEWITQRRPSTPKSVASETSVTHQALDPVTAATAVTGPSTEQIPSTSAKSLNERLKNHKFRNPDTYEEFVPRAARKKVNLDDHPFVNVVNSFMGVMKESLTGMLNIADNYQEHEAPSVVNNTMHSVQSSLNAFCTRFRHSDERDFEPVSSILQEFMTPAVRFIQNVNPAVEFSERCRMINDLTPAPIDLTGALPDPRFSDVLLVPHVVDGLTFFQPHQILETEGPPRIPFFFDDIEDPSLGAVVTPDGFIRLNLPGGILIDLTCDRGIRFRSLNDEVTACISPCGNYSALHSPLCQIHQHNSILDVLITDEFTDRTMYARADQCGVTFGGTMVEKTEFLDGNGRVYNENVLFTEIDSDFMDNVFLRRSKHGPRYYANCCAILKRCRGGNLANSSLHFVCDDTHVFRYSSGEVNVSRDDWNFMICYLPEIPNIRNGEIRLITPLQRSVTTIVNINHLRIEKNGFLVRFDNKWIYYTDDDFLVSNNNHSAGYSRNLDNSSETSDESAFERMMVKLAGFY